MHNREALDEAALDKKLNKKLTNNSLDHFRSKDKIALGNFSHFNQFPVPTPENPDKILAINPITN